MAHPAPRLLILLSLLFPAMTVESFAQDADTIARGISERVLFVTSGGYWEDHAEPEIATADAPEAKDATAPTAEAAADAGAPSQRGYYRLIAVRGADNRSLLELQLIALTEDGPKLSQTIAVDDINALGGYVTDIRPESSTGHSSGPGFAAFIYLKTDPTVTEPETWTLFVDEFGYVAVEKSSN